MQFQKSKDLYSEAHKHALLKVRVSERLARKKIQLALRVMEILGQGCTNFPKI